jgi:hypothetical protein
MSRGLLLAARRLALLERIGRTTFRSMTVFWKRQ